MKKNPPFWDGFTIAVVAVINKFLPWPPAVWAMEPPRPDDWTGDEQRPARPVSQFDAVSVGRAAEFDGSGRILLFPIHAAGCDRVLGVFAVEQD